MKIIVTGGFGFIGFNALQLWRKEHPEDQCIVIDNETYAAQFMLSDKKLWCLQNKIESFKLDISSEQDAQKIAGIVDLFKADAIVNFAAESHVDNSIKDPNIFFKTNVIGCVNMLNIAKDLDLRFHQVGTDEVYGVTWPRDNCYEGSMIKPSSPYSSSKASADLIALSYFKTFGTKVTVSRCTNNLGPWQHNEKLIPTVISRAFEDQKIPVYGDGKQKRHWIHVDDHNRALYDILVNGVPGEVYNIAPSKKSYIANIDIVKHILKTMKKPKTLIKHVTDRLGHDTSYFLKSKHYVIDSDWKKQLTDTVEWYMMMKLSKKAVSVNEDIKDISNTDLVS